MTRSMLRDLNSLYARLNKDLAIPADLTARLVDAGVNVAEIERKY